MKLKRIATITVEEGAEHAALLKEEEELVYMVAKFNLKKRGFLGGLLAKYEIKPGIVFTVKKRGIYTNG